MRMRVSLLSFAAVAALSACAGPVPDSGSGVGFQDYDSFMREQEAASARTAAAPLPGAPGMAGAGAFSTDIAAAAIDRATGVAPTAAPLGSGAMPAAPLPGAVIGAAPAYDPNAPLDPNRPRGNEPTTITGTTSEMTGIAGGNISDEQDFDAVASRETIESDAERIARNRAQYTVIQPTALPERTASTGPNLVEYALSTTHNPGTQMYTRSALRFTDPNAACARYTSSDLAQQAFIEAGGPKRDRKGLDPDGDGFACAWDPRPFRLQ